MSQTSVVITENGVAILHNGTHSVVSNDHPNITRIKAALRVKNYDEVLRLVDLRETVKRFLTPDEAFALEGDLIVFEGKPFTQQVTDKVLRMISAGNAPEPLYAFLRNVRKNPSEVAQDELLLFCEANGFMITEDGCILAYKKVNSAYKDCHTGTIDNSIGQRPSMAREEVDPDRHTTCSRGLHFAAYGYLSSYPGERIMLVKVNPADVVAIPSDYSNQKGRCWTYEVIGEMADQNPIKYQEVYTPTGEPIQDENVLVECALAAAEKLLENAERNLDELNSRIDDIENLGGEASQDQLNKRTELLADIERHENAVNELTEQLDDDRCEECGNCEEDCECCSDCGNAPDGCSCYGCEYCGYSDCYGTCQDE